MPRTEIRHSTDETSTKRVTDIVRTFATALAVCLPVTFASVATGQQTAPEPTLFDPVLATRQGAQLAKMTRWFTSAEVLRMATSTNAELLALSGNRSPYPGRLGVVEEGALADLLLVDGDPLVSIDLIADPTNLVVIMKDGRIHKDTVPD